MSETNESNDNLAEYRKKALIDRKIFLVRQLGIKCKQAAELSEEIKDLTNQNILVSQEITALGLDFRPIRAEIYPPAPEIEYSEPQIDHDEHEIA